MINRYLLRNIFVCLLLGFVFSSCAQRQVIASAGNYANTGATSVAAMKQNILEYINEHRAAIGKPPLKMINAASDEAYQHSADMAKKRAAFGHSGFEKRVQHITKQTGPVSAAAENVAYGKLTAKEVVNGWLKSPGHKKNIEGNYNLTGIGLEEDASGILFFTQIFLRK